MNGAVARVADCRATAVDTIRRAAVQALAVCDLPQDFREERPCLNVGAVADRRAGSTAKASRWLRGRRHRKDIHAEAAAKILLVKSHAPGSPATAIFNLELDRETRELAPVAAAAELLVTPHP